MNSQIAFKNQLLAVGFAVVVALLASGCGRANTVYTDPATAAGTQIDIDDSSLPYGFADQSENGAEVKIENSGTADSSVLFSTTSTVGSRAILGISKFDKLALEDFSGVEIELATSSTLSVSLQVDPDCASTSGLSDLQTLTANNVSASAMPSDTIWSVDGETDRVSLEAFLNEYPNACLRNGDYAGITLSTDSSQSVSLKTLKIQNETYENWGTK